MDGGSADRLQSQLARMLDWRETEMSQQFATSSRLARS